MDICPESKGKKLPAVPLATNWLLNLFCIMLLKPLPPKTPSPPGCAFCSGSGGIVVCCGGWGLTCAVGAVEVEAKPDGPPRTAFADWGGGPGRGAVGRAGPWEAVHAGSEYKCAAVEPPDVVEKS